ncbi:hypothetical protein RB195_019053 [Necator americanus]|uniref:Uncharacterized protein n=1 Tax=Necator americanus TaxID=51031 RepID=A0ABR1CCD1_NECAM
MTSSRLGQSDDVVLDLLGLHHQIFDDRFRCKPAPAHALVENVPAKIPKTKRGMLNGRLSILVRKCISRHGSETWNAVENEPGSEAHRGIGTRKSRGTMEETDIGKLTAEGADPKRGIELGIEREAKNERKAVVARVTGIGKERGAGLVIAAEVHQGNRLENGSSIFTALAFSDFSTQKLFSTVFLSFRWH